ncbi:alpha-1,3-mannosyl-glycoprotein 4-beta-N-acetylglucosaminyltransferase C-like [Liolophura sinensis]|uniref:alpha-1,3-mannosyl-glycoprotein 4-beta-N-acetylglucosaminyltransferase C-like n=1 Tax=Liolophura sinensis TaxID=3198878 RepID=UPI003158DBB5
MHRRSDRWYLQETLDSLIKHSREEDKSEVVVVVFLSDFDPSLRSELRTKITLIYPTYIDSGFIQIIEAPLEFYPSLSNLRTTYKHPMDQIIWRSKQNFDFAFLMQYSQSISEFYLQLEDDVVTVPIYVRLIKQYIARINRKAEQDWWSGVWTCLEFSELGFIAKLFHSYDLTKLASLLKLFYNEQPNDVLLLHFNEMMLQFRRYLRKPTIFQHRGFVSSLHRKREPLIDLMFSPNASMNDSSSERKGLIPAEIRRLNNQEGPEQELWEERKKVLREIFC